MEQEFLSSCCPRLHCARALPGTEHTHKQNHVICTTERKYIKGYFNLLSRSKLATLIICLYKQWEFIYRLLIVVIFWVTTHGCWYINRLHQSTDCDLIIVVCGCKNRENYWRIAVHYGDCRMTKKTVWKGWNVWKVNWQTLLALYILCVYCL
jgi:hypothetical protein